MSITNKLIQLYKERSHIPDSTLAWRLSYADALRVSEITSYTTPEDVTMVLGIKMRRLK